MTKQLYLEKSICWFNLTRHTQETLNTPIDFIANIFDLRLDCQNSLKLNTSIAVFFLKKRISLKIAKKHFLTFWNFANFGLF